MIYGIIAVLILAGIILYLDYRIIKLEAQVKDQCIKVDLLVYDFIKRNKKKVEKIDRKAIDELFK